MKPKEHRATLAEKRIITENILLIRIRPETPIHFVPGQHIVLKIPVGTIVMERPFSIASPFSPTDSIELFVKLISGGVASTFFETMDKGDSITFLGPQGAFQLHTSEHPIKFIASSTGVAPFRPMIHELLEKKLSRMPIQLVAIAQDPREPLLSHKFIALSRKYNNFTYVPVTDMAGYFSTMTLTPKEDIYLCGSPDFLHDIRTILLAKGIPPKQIRYEEFR